MSLNTAHASGGVLIYSGERILIYYDGVQMGFDMDSNVSHFKGNKSGRAYLTTHRVIFNTKDAKDTLQSFSMPFYCMREVELEQPVFGANYIKGKVRSEPGGNWDGTGKWKMWFNHGGAIEFGQAMLQAGRLASRYAPSKLPAYKAPTAPFYQAPPPAYTPPQGGMYGFVPNHTFPNPPPYNSVYMMQDPPPYPGIDPNLQPTYQPPYPPAAAANGYGPGQPAAPPYPPAAATNGYGQPAAPPYPPQAQGYAPGPSYPPQANGYPQGTSGEAKYNEAMGVGGGGSAYYSPTAPHDVYLPTQASAPPPGYDQATKKAQ